MLGRPETWGQLEMPVLRVQQGLQGPLQQWLDLRVQLALWGLLETLEPLVAKALRAPLARPDR